MFFDKELFVEAGKDPLLIRADQDLAALCGKLDDRINASGIIYHPFLYRHEPTWYEKQIFVNDDGLLFSQGPKKYRAAWDLLSDALGKWTTYDFLRGRSKKRAYCWTRWARDTTLPTRSYTTGA
jgi:hypothetical protein